MNIGEAINWYEQKLKVNETFGLLGPQNDAAKLALAALRHMRESAAGATPGTPGRKRCQFPNGIVIRPDGVNRLDPCTYKPKEIHTNVTVTVSQCERCGHVDLSWERQEDTEDIIYEKLAPEPDDD